MSRARWTGYIFCTVLVVMPSAALWAQPPIHDAGDHWTAWNPPPVADESTVYRVRQGDSLWSIAAERLGDPHLWPQIWERNQYILDSHWIYPGDPIDLSGAAVVQADLGAQDVMGPGLDDSSDLEGIYEEPFEEPAEEFETGIASLIDSTGTDAPVPLGYEADIYCTGYVGDPDEEFPYTIAGSEFDYLTPIFTETQGMFGRAFVEKYGLGLGDILYVDGGRADGLSAGELLSVINPLEKMQHPRTGDDLGRLYAYMGRLRVLSVQEETAIAEIVQLCSPITVGSVLKVFEPEPVPLRRLTPMRPVNYPASLEELEDASSIISSLDNLITGADLLTLGSGYLVLIDSGYNQDVAPGDIFTIYRRGREGYPPTIIGELGVLTVFDDTALARILRSRYAVYVGDPLQLK